MPDTGTIRQLLEVLDEHDRFLTSPPSRLRRQLAAAGLARCRALLEAICILCEQQRQDVVGVLLRALVEAWFLALYLLYKGDDIDDDSVLRELADDYAIHSRTMARAIGSDESLTEIMDAWEAEVAAGGAKLKKLKVEQIARALGPLIERDAAQQGFYMSVYDRVYRGESLKSVHAGIGAFYPYFFNDPSERADGLVQNPGSSFPGQEFLAAQLVIHLAQHVFKAFGVVWPRAIDDLYEEFPNRRDG